MGYGSGETLRKFVGPFELTKNSTQISQLQTSMDDPLKNNVRSSYSGKGSIKTAMNIVKHRGVLGLYSGFRLQLRMFSVPSTYHLDLVEFMG